MSEWDRLWEKPPKEIPFWNPEEGKCPHYYIADEVWNHPAQVKAEGDSLRLKLDILEEEALQQLHELDDCKEKLEALRPHLKEIQGLSPVPKIHLEALICRALWCQVWEILGVE